MLLFWQSLLLKNNTFEILLPILLPFSVTCQLIPSKKKKKNIHRIHEQNMQFLTSAKLFLPCRAGLVVSVSASHTVGRGFESWPGHTKHHHKNGANCLPA